MRGPTRRRVIGVALAGGVVLAATLVLSPAAVLRAVTDLSARPALFLAALAGVYLLRSAVLWPISAVSVLVGYVYGLELGVPVALAGAVVTCVPPFLVARYARTDAGVFGTLGRRGERLVSVTGALRGVTAARLAPLPADAVSYAAGLSGVSPRSYLLGTLLGELPWVVAAVLAGSSMRRLSVAGLDAGAPLVVGAAALAVLVLAGPAYRHLRERGEPV